MAIGVVTHATHMHTCKHMHNAHAHKHTHRIYLSIFTNNPDESSLALWVSDTLHVSRQLRENHLHHIIKVPKNIYRGKGHKVKPHPLITYINYTLVITIRVSDIT